MYKREAGKLVLDMAKAFKVLVVVGPRQVGKTTLLDEYKPEGMNKVSLDDMVLREQANSEPKLFLEEHPVPLYIDEVQYAPNLFSYIKLKVDQSEEKSQYWLTGSQPLNIMQKATESLAGRAGILNLNSFTYSEIEQEDKNVFEPDRIEKSDTISVDKLYERIFYGGMPELYSNKYMKKNIFFNSYIQTYIERDIRQLDLIGDLELYRKFIKIVASRTGELLNYSNLARDTGISQPTAVSWMSILVNSGLVYLLMPYSNSLLTRATHMPKIIFMDTGLASFLAEWDSPRSLQLSEDSGHYLESYIISDIVKSYNNIGLKANIYFYRNKEKEEIDLIFEKNGTLYPFEIKKSANPKREMIKNFEDLKSTKKKIGKGGVICLYDDLISLDEDNLIIPVSSVINPKK